MNLNALHRQLMQDVLEIGNNLPLVITRGYAVQAHQLVVDLEADVEQLVRVAVEGDRDSGGEAADNLPGPLA